MKTYVERKEAARDEAVAWSLDFNNHNYSYGELIETENYFYKLGKKYGLLTEFRENAII